MDGILRRLELISTLTLEPGDYRELTAEAPCWRSLSSKAPHKMQGPNTAPLYAGQRAKSLGEVLRAIFEIDWSREQLTSALCYRELGKHHSTSDSVYPTDIYGSRHRGTLGAPYWSARTM